MKRGEFSPTAGSFIRTGNYPLEAHYVFPTVEALKAFYADDLNKTLLHKGLLKVVENDGTGRQGLYWVTKKQTNDELEFTHLVSGTNVDSALTDLEELSKRLDEEIKQRKEADQTIWGTTDPTNVPDDLNSLMDLAEAVKAIKKDVQDIHGELIDQDDSNYKSLKAEIKAITGTQEDDIIEYLRTLPYQSITALSNELNKFINTFDNSTSKINTLPELQFFLEGYTDKDKLRHVLLDFRDTIYGDPAPSKDFVTLRAVEDFVRVFKTDTEAREKNIQKELDWTQVGVGLSSDGSFSADQETHYLQSATSVMNALKILDSYVHEAVTGITLGVDNQDVVDLAVRKQLEGYIISAKLALSNQYGNDLVKKDDGLYFNVDSTYENGILSLYVNGHLINQHVLGLSSIVDDAKYDPSQEAIIMVFKLQTGDKQTISIPVGALIREWDVDNSRPEKVVELEREVVIDGQDRLSADVRLWSDKSNILRKYGNTLGVEGISENIVHNGVALNVFLESLFNTVTENNTTLEGKINSEIERASGQEALIREELNAAKEELQGSIKETNDSIAETDESLRKEVIRATGVEESIKSSVEDLKKVDAELRQGLSATDKKITDVQTNVDNLQTDLEQKIGQKADQTALEEVAQTANSAKESADSANKTIEEVQKTVESVQEELKDKAPIDSPIFTGVPQVETSPDANDSSQRIPSTNWVNTRIKEEIEKISTDNFYTKDEVNKLLEKKADLVDGKVPESQLPKLYIIEVE